MAAGPVVVCPSCGAECRLAPAQLGQAVTCPSCRQPFTTAAAPPVAYAAGGFAPPAGPTSATAILSLIAGCLLCVPGMGLVAAVLGGIGLARTAPGRARGRGLAIAGLVLGIVGIGLWTLQLAVFLPALSVARTAARQVQSAANLRKIGLTLRVYEAGYGVPPPDLAALLAAEPHSIAPADFVDRSTADTPASDAAHLLAGGHCSYTYVPPAAATRPVVAYETHPDPARARLGRGPVVNVLRDDGSVVQMAPAGLAAILANPTLLQAHGTAVGPPAP